MITVTNLFNYICNLKQFLPFCYFDNMDIESFHHKLIEYHIVENKLNTYTSVSGYTKTFNDLFIKFLNH